MSKSFVTPCPPGSSVHGIFQARILEWVATGVGFPGHLPDAGIKLGSPTLAHGFFTNKPPGKSHVYVCVYVCVHIYIYTNIYAIFTFSIIKSVPECILSLAYEGPTSPCFR